MFQAGIQESGIGARQLPGRRVIVPWFVADCVRSDARFDRTPNPQRCRQRRRQAIDNQFRRCRKDV
jgi:hypothetical protein